MPSGKHKQLLRNNLSNWIDIFLSKFASTYSSNSLLRVLESWKKPLDQKKFLGVVIIDLSVVFEVIPSDIIFIAKLDGYSFPSDAYNFLSLLFKRRKQDVWINNSHCFFEILLSGIQQGPYLANRI